MVDSMIIRDNCFFSKIQYLSYFVIRAFFIAVLCLLSVFILLLLLYFGDLFLNVKSGNYSSPLFNGYVVVSQSMVPTININDAIVVKREKDKDYFIGDIISFFSTEYDEKGMVITHRIVDKQVIDSNLSNYTTKGDNNALPDRRSVSSKSVYGKVLFIIPKLGYVQQFLSIPKNFILCILIPSFGILVYDCLRIIFAFQKSKINS